MQINYKKLLIAIAIPFCAAAIGSLATTPNINSWYENLNKPSFAPPNWLFGPVWTVLYLMMGISFYIIWNKKDTSHWKNKAYTIFGIQLVLNTLWSFLFFQLHWMGVALIEIIVLWMAIFLTILVFSRISKLAAWLLVPYIAWVSFASLLNYYYWSLNGLKEV